MYCSQVFGQLRREIILIIIGITNMFACMFLSNSDDVQMEAAICWTFFFFYTSSVLFNIIYDPNVTCVT